MFSDSESRNLVFDAEGNMIDAQGQVLVPSHVFDQYLPDVRRQSRQAHFQQGERKIFQMLMMLVRVGKSLM